MKNITLEIENIENQRAIVLCATYCNKQLQALEWLNDNNELESIDSHLAIYGVTLDGKQHHISYGLGMSDADKTEFTEYKNLIDQIRSAMNKFLESQSH